jgi:Family of unknown function (DUF6978)
MAEDLTQEEADALLRMPKKRKKADTVRWPDPGNKVAVDLLSLDEREAFVLDVGRSYIKLANLKLQTRARVTVILVRLEIDEPPHRNPDDTELPCPHIHLYREGYQDKWAHPVPPEHFRDLSNRAQTVEDFMRYCQIVEPPEFAAGLFS